MGGWAPLLERQSYLIRRPSEPLASHHGLYQTFNLLESVGGRHRNEPTAAKLKLREGPAVGST